VGTLQEENPTVEVGTLQEVDPTVEVGAMKIMAVSFVAQLLF
jgi:hypothetical protein